MWPEPHSLKRAQHHDVASLSARIFPVCLEVMLEKDAGNPLIHHLRIIVLLEADFNIALRIIWMRRLFPAAEKMGFVLEQWGSRKNRNSTDCATMKILTFESCRH